MASRTGPVMAPVNIAFDDVLSNLSGAFTLHFEARKNKSTSFKDYPAVSDRQIRGNLRDPFLIDGQKVFAQNREISRLARL